MEKLIKFIETHGENLLSDFIKTHQKQLGGRTSLYLMICGRREDSYSFTYGKEMGELFSNTDRMVEKMLFAQSKVVELMKTGNKTTFKTQDYSLKKYGGGIKIYRISIAVSGFPPQLDHLFLRELLIAANAINESELKKIDEEFEKFKDHGVNE